MKSEINDWPLVGQNKSLKVAIEACIEAGKALCSGFSTSYRTSLNADKSDHTPFDDQSETIIETFLRANDENDPIISEELHPDYNDLPSTFWTIDGIDGTTNFSRQIPVCNVTLSKIEYGHIQYGVVYDFLHKELFYAMRQGGAYLNGKNIQIKNRKFDEAVICIYPMRYDPQRKNSAKEKAPVEIVWHAMKDIVEKTGRFPREFQSGALELSWIATGRLDAFCAAWTNPWDLSAGVLLIKESGGIVTDLLGQDWYPSTKGLVAGSRGVHDEILNVLRKRM